MLISKCSKSRSPASLDACVAKPKFALECDPRRRVIRRVVSEVNAVNAVIAVVGVVVRAAATVGANAVNNPAARRVNGHRSHLNQIMAMVMRLAAGVRTHPKSL
jgi:hypothetical protein